MSCQIVSPKQYNYVLNGVLHMALHSSIDYFYSHKAYKHFEGKNKLEEATRLVKSWMDLNDRSYDLAYNIDEVEPEPYSSELECLLYAVDDHVQFYKFLDCIETNIELQEGETDEQEDKDIATLRDLLSDLLLAAMRHSPAYDAAAWSIE